MAVDIRIVPVHEFHRVWESPINKYDKLALIADMCRVNALSAVKRAGSGHIGSSFSAMDIVVWLYYSEMNTLSVGLDNPNRDIYFSSKGHDVPGLYSVLYSLGVIPKEKFLKLRRYGGLDGHPDIGVRGIESNSGSLGMGISKGKGMALAKRLQGFGGRVYVMTGDGELQEGQNFEALQSAAQLHVNNLTVIVDHNKVQSDKFVEEIVDLGDLHHKLESFGWHIYRCNGHDMQTIGKTLEAIKRITDRPQLIIADTFKGRGVSFMEHPTAMQTGKGLYPWHAGAPDDASFEAAHLELVTRVNDKLSSMQQRSLEMETVKPEKVHSEMGSDLVGEPVSQALQLRMTSSISDEYVSKAYGKALVEIAATRKDLIVLDGDLSADCKIRDFEVTYPDRFIELGIAEQDMVSTAGGLARLGLLPVVNSFASFLVSRANEQIYNNASEGTKIIYALHYAGLIPAGPGKSHQSIRDISLLGALPNMTILQPCNAEETRLVVDYCVNEAEENCAIRLAIGPSPRKIQLPDNYRLLPGKGVALTQGENAALFAYGPVMLHEALLASEILEESGFGLRVVNMPWLNRIDQDWLAEVIESYPAIYVLEDHAPTGGLGDFIMNSLAEGKMRQVINLYKYAVDGYPACGTPAEALHHHKLNGINLANALLRNHDKPLIYN